MESQTQSQSDETLSQDAKKPRRGNPRLQKNQNINKGRRWKHTKKGKAAPRSVICSMCGDLISTRSINWHQKKACRMKDSGLC